MKQTSKILYLTVFLLLFFDRSVFSEEASTEKTAQEQMSFITLVEEHEVPSAQSPTITLGELAKTMICPDPELAKKLMSMPVVSAPKPGEQDRLGKQQIVYALRQNGFEYGKINLQGPSVINILGHGQRVTLQQMIDAIQQQVELLTSWKEGELVLQVLSTPSQDAWLPAGDFEMQVTRQSPYVFGSNRYEVQFFINKILVKTCPFLVSVKRQRKVFIPNREIRPGEVIAQEDIREMAQMVENENLDRQLVDNAAELIGRRAKTKIHRDKPIQWFALENNYILKRGDLVQILVKSNNLTLQTTGQAQQRAAVGDIINIKTTTTGKTIKGKVLSRNLVELITS